MRRRSCYELLCRTFFAQLFSSETVTSDLQLRQALIAVLAFLVTPGLLLPFQMDPAFEGAVIRYASRPPGFPGLLEPLIHLFATLFIAYAIVTIGFIGAFTWDGLGFDRRDAMVLGPLPMRGSVVIRAKLTALALLMLATAASVSVMTAIPFAMIASNYSGAAAIGRHAVAHLAATISAATCVFCALVTLRATLGLFGQERKAIASLLQFAVVSALLCFVVLLPSAMHVVPARRRASAVQVMTLPSWNPLDMFLGMFETIRGTSDPGFRADAMLATIVTVVAVAAAVGSTIVGYRRQLQRALTPPASPGFDSQARAQRRIARALAGTHRVARALADFIVTTLARNRAQQTPIAINAAIGLAIIVAALSRPAGGATPVTGLRTAILWIPLVCAYWIAIGLRASFFVPGELPSAWAIRVNGPDDPRACWSAVRAAAVAVILPLALLAELLIVPAVGWRVGTAYAAVVCAFAVLIAEWVALTIDFIPFTRPYKPGHAKLKSRWPLYLIGVWLFAFWPARFALAAGGRPGPLLTLATITMTLVALFEVAGRRAASRRAAEEWETGDETDGFTVLGIGVAAHSAVGA